ncbi:tetratricopeptide repeat protein [Micromonospora sp. NPDC050200]|uniref:tetratricopeptide repeat protein n=1 Tax=Micromonospora sp. NPDC050200 TaxID=3155664 RepID=UPI0033E49A24
MTGEEPDLDGCRQRAQLLAELGRYDEAVEELGFALALDPTDAVALALLARVHLVAGRPAEALTAADAASAGAPTAVAPLVLRGFALADLEEYAESARTADRILAVGPTDAYAQRGAAGILAEARNGQSALNAAWRGVELAPDEPQAHLVLALVAGRLELFDLAERAYREALRLDPELAEARQDPGVIRLERRRWAEALEQVAALASVNPGRAAGLPVTAGIRRVVLLGGAWTLVGSLVVAALAPGGAGLARAVAVLAAVAGALAVWRLATRVAGLRRDVLPDLWRTDRPLALAVYGVAAGPALLLLHTLVGTPWPLVAAIAVTTAAVLAVLTRPPR